MNKTISIDDPRLEFIQANILKGHGRRFAAHLFFSIDEAFIDQFKNWFSNFDATSAQTQLRDTQRYKMVKPQPEDTESVKCVCLTWTGYVAAGLQEYAPQHIPFEQGMAKRRNILGDPAEKEFSENFQQDVHGMVLLAHDHKPSLDRQLKKLIQEIELFKKHLFVEHGRVIRNENGQGIEHFGYADGISQPLFLEDDIKRAHAKMKPLLWDPACDAEEILLVKEPKIDVALGSFMVFRKLEQNVEDFKAQEKRLAEILGLTEEEEQEIVGALAVGRFEDGTPVVLSQKEDHSLSTSNNFNYNDDNEGAKCPYHAHIRKVNPRNGELLIEKGNPAKRRLLARRGIPYDEIGRGFIDELNDIPNLEHHPSAGVGLLFIAFMSDLEQQFEFIQQNWANNQDSVNPNEGLDPIIGNAKSGNNPPQYWPIDWGKPAKLLCDFQGYVTLKGGGYFFAPSLQVLNSIKSSLVPA